MVFINIHPGLSASASHYPQRKIKVSIKQNKTKHLINAYYIVPLQSDNTESRGVKRKHTMKQDFEREILQAIQHIETLDKEASLIIYKFYQYTKMLENDYSRQMEEIFKLTTEQIFPSGKVDIKEK